jgi:hypothetical protein
LLIVIMQQSKALVVLAKIEDDSRGRASIQLPHQRPPAERQIAGHLAVVLPHRHAAMEGEDRDGPSGHGHGRL